MKALRYWNHNGKDNLFDHVTDRYIYEKVFKEDKKQEPVYRSQNSSNYLDYATRSSSSEEKEKTWEHEHPLFTVIMLLITIAGTYIFITDLLS